MRMLLLNFACKRLKYADPGGGGSKTSQTLRSPLWMAPYHDNINHDNIALLDIVVLSGRILTEAGEKYD